MKRADPRNEARLGGALYAIVIITAFFAELFVRSSLIVPNSPAATVHNILASERLYRLGGLADLVNLSCDIGVAIVRVDVIGQVG